MADKLVIVVSEGLERGVAANIISLLGVSIGHHVTGIVGPDVRDATGHVHPGMSTIGLPVLAAAADTLATIHREAAALNELMVFDVTDAAVASPNYESYTARLQDSQQSWRALGVAIYGPRRQVDRVTGRLPLLR